MQRLIANILSFVVVFLTLAGSHSHAQVKVQVVTQKITKSINWKQGMALWVHAERAEIYCTTHASSTIKFDVEFIAKNESRKAAETDLKKMKWLNETVGKKVFLRNYIELDRNESKPESDIKVIYHIKVPESCAVNINNYFGKINIENMNSELTINSEFSKINLGRIGGKITIKTNFGDISAHKISGVMQIESIRSDIDLLDVAGVLDLQSKLADIRINDIEEISKIIIDAEKSKINLKIKDYNKFSFNLDLYKSELAKPDNMKLVFTKNEKETIKAGFNLAADHTQIDIKLNTGNLTIEPK